MADKSLQFYRGPQSGIPTLKEAEPGWTTDEKRLYVGDGTSNVAIANKSEVDAVQSDLDTLEADAATKTELATKQDKLTGTQGQVVGFDDNGNAVAQAAPDTGVTSFKGRKGTVTPQNGDYTADMVGARPNTWTPSASDVGAVPTSRTVNGKALSNNITLGASDVGAVPTSRTVNGKALTGNISLAASDVGAVPTSRTVNGKSLNSNISLSASDVGAAPQYTYGTTDLTAGSSTLATGTLYFVYE